MTRPEPSHTPKEHFTAPLLEPSLSSLRSLREPRARVVHEFWILLLKGEHDVAYRPVAVLGDDQVCLARARRLRLVVLLAVDEHQEVRILPHGAAGPQVRKERPLVASTLLAAAAGLGERDDGIV